jgi:hypothetical protein
MSKKGIEIPLDKETYRALEFLAKREGLTVDEAAAKIVKEMYDKLKAKES